MISDLLCILLRAMLIRVGTIIYQRSSVLQTFGTAQVILNRHFSVAFDGIVPTLTTIIVKVKCKHQLTALFD